MVSKYNICFSTQSNNIVRYDVLAQIGFVGVNNVLLLDTGIERPIRGELFIANENLIVPKKNARITCRTIVTLSGRKQ